MKNLEENFKLAKKQDRRNKKTFKLKFLKVKQQSDKIQQDIPDRLNIFFFWEKIFFKHGPLNIFVKKDFTPIFNDQAKINNKYGVQIGLELLYINF